MKCLQITVWRRRGAFRIVKGVLKAKGASDRNAAIVAEHLITSDLSGIRSHGFIRLPQYVDEVAVGELDPAKEPSETRALGGRIDMEGGRCFGQVAALEAVRLAEVAARRHGISLVTVHQTGHTGRLGTYAEVLGNRVFLGVIVCSSSKMGHRVAQFGGREARIATNPIAYGIPSTTEPVVGDFSTAVAPEGVIRVLRNRGLAAPPDTLLDVEGEPTTDPSVLYRELPGTILPLGGLRIGYRGFALGLLVEAMATLLAGDDTDDAARTGSNLGIIAVQTDEGFRARTDRL